MSNIEYNDDSFDTGPDEPMNKPSRVAPKPKASIKGLEIRANIVLALGIICSAIVAILVFCDLNLNSIFCNTSDCLDYKLPLVVIMADVFCPICIVLAAIAFALAFSVYGSLSERRKSKRAGNVKRKNTVGLVLSLLPVVALVILTLI